MTERNETDHRLMANARTLAEGLVATRERVEEAERAWILADWRRLRASEIAKPPRTIARLTEESERLRKEYEGLFAYHFTHVSECAEYLRKQVRDGR